jgi:hypothetical protein
MLTAVSAWADHHVPESESPVSGELGPDFMGRFAIIADVGDWNPLLELDGRIEGSDRELRYRALTAGTYYRPHRNLKIGSFYRVQAGARHDDDWEREGTDDWRWKESEDRYEHLLLLDATPRFLLGRSGVASAKLRYEYNLSIAQQVLLLGPGYTWFYMRDREPRWNLSLHYSLYFSLNFGDVPIYRHGPYASMLIHLSELLKMELRGEYQTRIWSTSEDSEEVGDSYVRYDRRVLLGLGFVLTPRF